MDRMGPPAPPDYRKPHPEEGRDEPKKKDRLEAAMTALFLAQDADMESTNDLLELNGQLNSMPSQKQVPRADNGPMSWGQIDAGSIHAPDSENIAPEGKPDPHSHQRRVNTFEMNPLPGMKSDTGRMLWGMAEHAAIKEISKKHKTIGKVLPLAMALIHAGLASNNWRQAQNLRSDLK